MSGAVHELTHYIYDRAPAEKHRALIDEFGASGTASYAGLYTYLNEAVAIAAHALHADSTGETPDEDRPIAIHTSLRSAGPRRLS